MVNLALTLSLHSVLRASFYYHNVRPERHPLKPSTIVSHPHFLCSSNAVALSTLFTLFSLPLLFQIVFDVKAHTEKTTKKKQRKILIRPFESFTETLFFHTTQSVFFLFFCPVFMAHNLLFLFLRLASYFAFPHSFYSFLLFGWREPRVSGEHIFRRVCVASHTISFAHPELPPSFAIHNTAHSLA